MSDARAGLGDERDPLISRLAVALEQHAAGWRGVGLTALADKGLAHDHIRIEGQDLVVRIPKQSQMGLGAQENLDYQAACFARASAGGHVPELRTVLPPSASLPRGGLILEFIEGEPPILPKHLPAIAEALASIHSLPMPDPSRRPPIKDEADPFADLVAEVERQACYLDRAGLDTYAEQAIRTELGQIGELLGSPNRPPKALISFDAHPGNFIVRPDGSAVLVDLEKARYAYPPLDLAHATLYTSTTWDIETYAELALSDVVAFVRAWSDAYGGGAGQWEDWIVPLRRAMWLWSVTWCAKWRVLSQRERDGSASGEDWSAANSDGALVRHVQGRVDCYLTADIVARVRSELEELADALRY